jgi:predicted transcriptional regulator
MFTSNISLARNSEISNATVQIRGDPYIKDEGLENQTVQWPQNPSMDILGDGSPEWAFQGTMGMQDRFSDNSTESRLWWDAPGKTHTLDLTVPRSTIRSASLTVNTTDRYNFSYAMDLGGTQVWNRQALSFSFGETSFCRDTLNDVVLGDINGDNRTEMVAAGADGNVYVAKNVNGKWVNASVIPLQIQSGQRDIMQVALGRLDGTPGLDIVAACADGNVYYLLNQGGTGLYSGAKQLVSGSTGRMASVAVKDVDGDGNNDIVAGNLNGRFYVFLNAGEASFDPSSWDGLKVVLGGNGQMNAVAVCDIDRDGNQDLIGANSDKNMYIARGTGEHSSFEPARPVITTAFLEMNSISVEDVNGDGYKDLVGASNDGRVYACLNLGSVNFGCDPGYFDTQPGHIIKLAMESGTNGLCTATAKDVNGDGLPDIVALSYNTGQIYVAMNDGGNFIEDNIMRPFSTGQISRSLAVDDVNGDGAIDIAVANGLRMDVWLNDQGVYADTINGPGFSTALQDYINNTPATEDRFGNPMITCSLRITNLFSGVLNFSCLSIIYDYTATADMTAGLSGYMNATAGPYSEGEMLQIPVVFKVESAGVLNIGELRIDSEIGLVPIISFPTENSTLYYKEQVFLTGYANKDPDGIALNYTWTDIINGRFLGYGSKIKYTPTTMGYIIVELLVKDELHDKEASLPVHFQVVERPVVNLKISKLVLSNSEPTIGEAITMTVYVGNYPGTTGIIRLNATNVGFQVYLDKVHGTPIAAGIIQRVDANRVNSTRVVWDVQTTSGTHKLIVVIMICDQQYTSPQYMTTIKVHQSAGYAIFPLITPMLVGGIPIGMGVLALFLGGTEAGTYALFLFFLPLYSKMRPEEVLDSFIRGKILGYIRANPGCHYNLIKQDLKLHNGTLIHHLDTLERNGYVKSVRDGLLRRFFPGDQKIPQGRFYMNPMQKSMSKFIREHPGVSQAELTRGLYLEPHVVRYHIRILKEAKILRVEDDGVRTRLFLR